MKKTNCQVMNLNELNAITNNKLTIDELGAVVELLVFNKKFKKQIKKIWFDFPNKEVKK